MRTIHFKDGFVGFRELTEWSLEFSEPYTTLRSVQDPSVRFIMISPYRLKTDYFRAMSDVYVILTVPTSPDKATANLKAPVLISGSHGEQIILPGSEYNTRHNVLKMIRDNDALNELCKDNLFWK